VREIELSTHERTLPQAETEVEHAHSDLLQGFVDSGWLGGLFWLAFLACVGVAAWRCARSSEDDVRAPLGIAALAILANALLREPLLWNPAASSAAFALFGVLLAVDHDPIPGLDTWKRRVLVLLAIALVASNLARAWSMAWHGRAIAQFVATSNPAFSQLALEVCEDSPVARAVVARAADANSQGKDAEPSVAAWEEVLLVRPHNVEALIQLSIALARTDRGARAIETLEHARTLDPGHKTVQLNLARMHALFGDLAQVDARLAASGADAKAAFRSYANSALRELRIERGFELLARVDPRYAKLGAELAYALGREVDSPLDEEGRVALEGAAHVLWARDHGASGRFDDALRSYRQAKRCLAPRDGSLAPLALSLEFAGACAAAGKLDEARAELGERELSAAQLARLPEWIGQALFENGLLAR
jgi:tetratricopeptide (TPR) repeat protein